MIYTYVLLSRLLPVQQPDRICIFHAKWNQLDVRFGQILLLQAIDSTFPIFLREDEAQYRI
jgi:hypothetical protein